MTGQAATGPRVLITRSREGNRELAARLRVGGFEPISIETIRFSPPHAWTSVDRTLKKLHEFDWMLFTSATGVDFFVRRMRSLGLSLTGKVPRVGAVGEKTARALSKNGLAVDFVPSSYTTKSLGEELPPEPGKNALLVCGAVGDETLTKNLGERGFTVLQLAIYRTTNLERRRGHLAGAAAVVFGSPSAVEGLCEMMRDDELADLRGRKAFCIGPVTATAARAHGFRKVVVPRRYTFEALVEEMRRTMMNDA